MSGAAATNLHNVFLGLSERFGAQTALADRTRSITFGQLGSEVSRTARALQAEGVEPGQHVGIASKDGLSAMLAMLGAWGAGATAVHVDFRSRPDEKKRLAEEFDLDIMLEDRRSSSASILSPSMRVRQRVIEKRSAGSLCWKWVSPQKAWKYGFSTQAAHTASSDRPLTCLSRCSPTISRVGRRGRPRCSTNVAP